MIINKYRLTIIISLTVLSIIAMLIGWQVNLKRTASVQNEIKQTASAEEAMKSPIYGPVPIDDLPGGGFKRVRSLAKAESETGISLSGIPIKLFGKDGQIFLTGNQHTAIIYSKESTPTTFDPGINIGPRIDSSNLVSYEQIVEQGQKKGIPIELRQHNGNPGYTVEKSVDQFMGGKTAPKPASVTWMKNGIQYIVVAPVDMALSELLPITDAIE